MKKILLSLIAIQIGFLSYGQSNSNFIIKDSTKIKILGNTVYRSHEAKYITKNSIGRDITDSTSIRYSKILLLNVIFDTSKSEILSKSFDELNKLSTLLKNNPKIKLEINGHTDKIGNSKHNLKLSKRRAKAIKMYLKKKGVRSKRIVTKGFGDKFPICESPCEKNRRVEFEFIVP